MAIVCAKLPAAAAADDVTAVAGDISELVVLLGERAELGWLSTGDDNCCCCCGRCEVSTTRGVASEIGDAAAKSECR